MKKCSTCKAEKSFELFSKNKWHKDGHHNQCKDCKKISDSKFRKNNENYNKEYYEKNKNKISLQKKDYRNKNINEIKKYKKEWYEKNKENIIKYNKEYLFKRSKSDYIFKFSLNVKSLIRGSFKRGEIKFKKNSRTETILGCTIKDFREHIEKQFSEGMSFENHGKWHLDHIIPLSIAKTENEVVKLNHYTNFQPLWAADNIRKSNKF